MWKQLGYVYNNAHSASPVLVGDYEQLKAHWRWDDDDEVVVDVGSV